LTKIPNAQDFLLKIFVVLHNYSYKILTILATNENNDEHPKYEITKYYQFFLDHVEPTDTVIDVGCGNGIVACKISEKAKKVMGVDYKAAFIKEAKQNCQKDNVTFLVEDATTYEFNERFDAIILSNVLEHIDERVGLLKKLHRLSDKLLLRVPMITRDWLAVYKRQKGLEYRLSKDHRLEYSLEDVQHECSESGWQIDEYQIAFGEFWGVLKSGENF
jgi:2-polyprenyl-3-methyl-5-hydroxy-6-metoxy-1,4-benzoquinol methylase